MTPGLRGDSLVVAALNGALFGFFTYATYDLTNQATLRNWTTQLTLIDASWGVALGAIAASTRFSRGDARGGSLTTPQKRRGKKIGVRA